MSVEVLLVRWWDGLEGGGMGSGEREGGGGRWVGNELHVTSGDSFIHSLISASLDLFAYVKFYIGYRLGR